jgi:hypothetical protein
LILGSVEIIERLCFAESEIEIVTFEAESRLNRIEERYFRRCPLTSFFIPKDVDFICGSAFGDTLMKSISVDRDNRRFGIERDFFMDVIDCIAIRYLGEAQELEIPKSIRSMAKTRFDHRQIKDVSFEAGSQMTHIDAVFFYCCSLESICISRSVETFEFVAFLARSILNRSHD